MIISDTKFGRHRCTKEWIKRLKAEILVHVVIVNPEAQIVGKTLKYFILKYLDEIRDEFTNTKNSAHFIRINDENEVLNLSYGSQSFIHPKTKGKYIVHYD